MAQVPLLSAPAPVADITHQSQCFPTKPRGSLIGLLSMVFQPAVGSGLESACETKPACSCSGGGHRWMMAVSGRSWEDPEWRATLSPGKHLCKDDTGGHILSSIGGVLAVELLEVLVGMTHQGDERWGSCVWRDTGYTLGFSDPLLTHLFHKCLANTYYVPKKYAWLTVLTLWSHFYVTFSEMPSPTLPCASIDVHILYHPKPLSFFSLFLFF